MCFGDEFRLALVDYIGKQIWPARERAAGKFLRRT